MKYRGYWITTTKGPDGYWYATVEGGGRRSSGIGGTYYCRQAINVAKDFIDTLPEVEA